jgi:hypothetical protein
MRHRAVGRAVHVRAVVAGVHDDGVVGDPHIVERLLGAYDGVVVLHHPVDVLAVAVFVTAAMLRAHVRAKMHARRVEPGKERLPGCWRCMKSMAAADVSSSMVSIQFFVRRPVSSIACLPIFRSADRRSDRPCRSENRTRGG